jgi:hypothetical protein
MFFGKTFNYLTINTVKNFLTDSKKSNFKIWKNHPNLMSRKEWGNLQSIIKKLVNLGLKIFYKSFIYV